MLVTYNGANKEINLIALSTVNNHPIRFFIQYRSKTEMTPASYIFGVDSEVTGFENLPLVGGEMKDVSFTNVGFVYASAAQKYYGYVITKSIEQFASRNCKLIVRNRGCKLTVRNIALWFINR